MEDDAPLASLSLTHVHYNPGDPVSFLCAWLALTPQALCVIYVTLIWSNRELEVIAMGLGQFCCEVLNFVLKRILKEERPPQMNGKGYGMPSSHAQFLSFFATSLSLFLLFRHRPPASRESQSNRISLAVISDPAYFQKPLNLLERSVLSGLAFAVAAAVAWSRVYLMYHTPRQVVVGSGAGFLIACAWFAVTWKLRGTGWADWACGTWLGRAARIRDLVIEQDFAEAGWKEWRERHQQVSTAGATTRSKSRPESKKAR